MSDPSEIIKKYVAHPILTSTVNGKKYINMYNEESVLAMLREAQGRKPLFIPKPNPCKHN